MDVKYFPITKAVCPRPTLGAKIGSASPEDISFLFHTQAAGTGVIGSFSARMRWVQWYLITSRLGGSNTNKRARPELEGREELHVPQGDHPSFRSSRPAEHCDAASLAVRGRLVRLSARARPQIDVIHSPATSPPAPHSLISARARGCGTPRTRMACCTAPIPMRPTAGLALLSAALASQMAPCIDLSFPD